jgi:hypothetical protein
MLQYYFSKSQAGDWLSAFSKAELMINILFEALPVWLLVKPPELVIVFTKASRNLKSISVDNLDAKN